MDFSFSEEQEMLRRMARDFGAAECPKSLVREIADDEIGFPAELWKKMAKLGWMGLVFPERYGGEGASFLDLTVLLEEMGRACIPGPFFSTVVLGGMTVLQAGNEEQKQEVLPRLSKGELFVTLALAEPGVSYEPSLITVKAVPDDGDYLIDGTKLFVPDAHIADKVICVAKASEGPILFLLDAKSPGIEISPLKTVSGEKQCEVVFHEVRAPVKSILGKGLDTVEKVLAKAKVAKCAEMVGIAEQALEMSVDYAKQRVQFGRPIGSFQTIQNYCANMVTDVETSRLITCQAAWMLSEGIPCAKEIAIAKGWVSSACHRVVALAHQIHGAIGFTAEHELGLYYKRAKAAELAFGHEEFHKELLAEEIGL